MKTIAINQTQALLSKEYYVDIITKRVKQISTGIEGLLKERRAMNDTFSKLSELSSYDHAFNSFGMLSMLSDDIDMRYATHITELKGVVKLIDEMQSTYGEDKALSNIRDFYVTNVL